MSSADSKRHPLRSRASENDQPGDAPLVERLRTGDAEAFAEIVRAWSPMMLHVARMYVSTDASAQEVVQEAWLAMIQGLDKFEGRSSLLHGCWRFWETLAAAAAYGKRGACRCHLSARRRTTGLPWIPIASVVQTTSGPETGHH